MSDFKILKKGEKAESLYGIENKKITELELEALLDGKRIWTDINWEYAMTIQLKDRFKELELDKEIERLNNIIDEKDYKIKRIVYSCYESDMSYEEFKAIWVNAFEKLYDPKDIDKLENELKGDNK